MLSLVQAPEPKTQSADRRPTGTASAVVWLNGRHAIVARLDKDGRITTSIERGYEPELSYLNLVIRAIGDRERVVILGPGSVRLALDPVGLLLVMFALAIAATLWPTVF